MSTPLPTLDQVLADPDCLAGLPPESLAKLLLQIAAAQTTVTARLVLAAAVTNGNGAAPVEAREMLSVPELAKLLKRTPRWIWRNQRKLPFLRRVGGRGLLASRRDIEAWLAAPAQRVK